MELSNLEQAFDFSVIGSVLNLTGRAGLTTQIQERYPSLEVSETASGRFFDLVIAGSNVNSAIKSTKHTLVYLNADESTIENLEISGLAHWPEAEKLMGGNARVYRTWKFLKPHSGYFIQQLNSDDANHHVFHLHPGLYYKSLQAAFLDLARTIIALSEQGKAASIVRASDGDYYFLRKVEIGSAKPGRRALTVPYEKIDMALFRRLFWQNDIIAVSIEPSFHNSWKKYLFYEKFDKFFWKLNFKFRGQNSFKYLNFIFDKIFSPIIKTGFFLKPFIKNHPHKNKAVEILNKTQTPMEAVYSLVPSKWIFRNFKNQIGIIAGEKKCELIGLLMQREEYRNYIGMDKFTDYVAVPQKGAADNLEALAKDIGEKIKHSQAKIFLVGVGSAKLGLLPLLKQYKNAIFIDVGAGLDALAGVVCQQRPYFCEWTDYRINGYDYSKVDFMDQGNPAWNNPEYKTKWID